MFCQLIIKNSIAYIGYIHTKRLSFDLVLFLFMSRAFAVFFLVIILFACDSKEDNLDLNFEGLKELDSDLIIRSTADIDSFSLKKYQVVNGDVLINIASDSVLDLAGLNTINCINGSLTVQNCPYLKELSGFDSLKVVTGNLTISENMSLSSLAGLSTLTFKVGDLMIYGNSTLQDLKGLEGIDSIQTVSIIDNNQLAVIGDGMFFSHIERSLEISGNTSLTNIRGFNRIRGKLPIVTVSNNPVLQSIVGFNYVKNVTDYIEIVNNPKLNLFDAFGFLKEVNELSIKNNNELSSLDGFDQVDVRIKSLNISDNPRLHTVSGFDNCPEISKLSFVSDSSLREVRGFSKLLILDHLILEKNMLRDITVFKDAAISKSLVIKSCNQIQLLSTDTLSFIGSDELAVKLINNDNLQDISALSNLVEVGILEIADNDKLSSLGGLEQLEEVAASHSFERNKLLVDFCALTYWVEEGDVKKLKTQGSKYQVGVLEMEEGKCLAK